MFKHFDKLYKVTCEALAYDERKPKFTYYFRDINNGVILKGLSGDPFVLNAYDSNQALLLLRKMNPPHIKHRTFHAIKRIDPPRPTPVAKPPEPPKYEQGTFRLSK